jgi:hypothetical protein
VIGKMAIRLPRPKRPAEMLVARGNRRWAVFPFRPLAKRRHASGSATAASEYDNTRIVHTSCSTVTWKGYAPIMPTIGSSNQGTTVTVSANSITSKRP